MSTLTHMVKYDMLDMLKPRDLLRLSMVSKDLYQAVGKGGAYVQYLMFLAQYSYRESSRYSWLFERLFSLKLEPRIYIKAIEAIRAFYVFDYLPLDTCYSISKHIKNTPDCTYVLAIKDTASVAENFFCLHYWSLTGNTAELNTFFARVNLFDIDALDKNQACLAFMSLMFLLRTHADLIKKNLDLFLKLMCLVRWADFFENEDRWPELKHMYSKEFFFSKDYHYIFDIITENQQRLLIQAITHRTDGFSLAWLILNKTTGLNKFASEIQSAVENIRDTVDNFQSEYYWCNAIKCLCKSNHILPLPLFELALDIESCLRSVAYKFVKIVCQTQNCCGEKIGLLNTAANLGFSFQGEYFWYSAFRKLKFTSNYSRLNK